MDNPQVRDRSAAALPDVRLGRSVSIEQAMELLRVSRRTIYYRIREGRLRTIRTIGGSQRVLLDSIRSETQPASIPHRPSGNAHSAHSQRTS